MSILRPWWRRPFAYLLRIRPRPRHLRGSLAHRLLGTRLFDPDLWIPSRKSIAKGAAIGAFLGFSPLFGLHIPISILLCYVFRASITTGILATFVSNPITIAGLAWVQVKLGKSLLPGLTVASMQNVGMAGYFAEYGKPFLLGSCITSIAGGLLAYPLALWFWDISKRGAKRRQTGIRDR